jgi:glycine cleavage system H protein
LNLINSLIKLAIAPRGDKRPIRTHKKTNQEPYNGLTKHPHPLKLIIGIIWEETGSSGTEGASFQRNSQVKRPANPSETTVTGADGNPSALIQSKRSLNMEYPKDLKYAKTDEWVKVEDGVATIGITDYAQDSLSDVVYVEFDPDAGDAVQAGDSLATIESVKAAAEVLFPVGGEVLEVNSDLADSPETLNEAPYTDGWLAKVKLEGEPDLSGLMDAAAYEEYCKDR